MRSRVVPAGDSAWLIELPDRLDEAVNRRAIQMAAHIERTALPWVTDLVVGYRTVMVYVDPLVESGSVIERTLAELATGAPEDDSALGALVEVPICYGGDFGPDLADVARFGGCSPEDVIARHVAIEYRVYVVGFVPGWAYMASVDETIAAPRRSSPRVTVPPGSLGIAGRQTGIYPAATPGGWNLIGRCPQKPYDPDRAQPFLFHAGDRVRFRRITPDEYASTTRWGDV